jgi:alanyl-tRNA synthetase
MSNDDLRRLAIATRDALEHGVVAIVGALPDGKKAGLVVAVTKDLVAVGVSAADVAREPVKLLGGGTSKGSDLAVGGGPVVDALDDALALLESAARSALAEA